MYARNDTLVDPGMAVELTARGIASEDFRSRRLTPALVDEADLVLTAEASHRAAILDEHPVATRKVLTFGQADRALDRLDASVGRAELADRAGRGPGRRDRRPRHRRPVPAGTRGRPGLRADPGRRGGPAARPADGGRPGPGTVTKVLVVTPAFHGYGDSIGNALRRRGHQVVVHPYDAHVTAWQKARHKLTVELPGQLGVDRRAASAQRATDDTLRTLDAARPDVVLVIRGDLLEERFWDRARARSTARRAVALRRGPPDALRHRHPPRGPERSPATHRSTWRG